LLIIEVVVSGVTAIYNSVGWRPGIPAAARVGGRGGGGAASRQIISNYTGYCGCNTTDDCTMKIARMTAMAEL